MDPARITITIIGDGGCGKSSITLRLVRSQWTSEYDPTIEDSYSITRSIDGQTYHLSLTDTAGQEEYRGMWSGGNMSSDAFLMVYDITSIASLGALEEFNALVDMEGENRREEQAHQAAERQAMNARDRSARSTPKIVTMPVKIVAGNKCDLQQSRQVDAKTGLEWARKHGCGFMETSARNTVNIEETFALIVRRVVEARRKAVEELVGRPGGQPSGKTAPPPQVLALDGSGSAPGTRRAVTAPLSPLPRSNEKGSAVRDGKKTMWSWLKCW